MNVFYGIVAAVAISLSVFFGLEAASPGTNTDTYMEAPMCEMDERGEIIDCTLPPMPKYAAQ